MPVAVTKKCDQQEPSCNLCIPVKMFPDIPIAGQSNDDDDDVQSDQDMLVAVTKNNDLHESSCNVCTSVQAAPEMYMNATTNATTTKEPQESSSDQCLSQSFALVSFQDAVRDFGMLLPWSTSTDEALNLPRQGFCHEKLVLEMYQWRQSASDIPSRGLTNIGNTCFVSSILQCLAHCPAFCQIIRLVAPRLKVNHAGNQFT